MALILLRSERFAAGSKLSKDNTILAFARLVRVNLMLLGAVDQLLRPPPTKGNDPRQLALKVGSA
jgi:hypothetical protein